MTDDRLSAMLDLAIRNSAVAALMEARRLLAMRGMPDAADALLLHIKAIPDRLAADYAAKREGV